MKAERHIITPHSNEWYLSRLSKFSSSGLHKLMGSAKKKENVFTDTALTYIYEKVSETISGMLPDQATSHSLDWGISHEAEAIAEFTRLFQKTVETGIVYHLNEFFCGTPDGETDTHILEVKCPYNGGNHIKHTLVRDAETMKKIRPEYYWQVQGNMWLSGKDKAYFISYDPRLPRPVSLHVVEIEAKIEDIEEAKKAIEMAGEYKERMMLNIIEQYLPA